MKIKLALLFCTLIFLLSCKKEDFKHGISNGISFKLQHSDSTNTINIENGEWTYLRYISNLSSGLLDDVLEVSTAAQADSAILAAQMEYRIPADQGLSTFDILTITILRKESYENLTKRDPQTTPHPMYDYQNPGDIIENMFPTGQWNPHDDLKVVVNFNNGGFMPNQTADFPNDMGNTFELTEAVFSETEDGFGKVQLKGNFECLIPRWPIPNSVLYHIMDAQFSIELNLGE